MGMAEMPEEIADAVELARALQNQAARDACAVVSRMVEDGKIQISDVDWDWREGSGSGRLTLEFVALERS